jgi:hypothetical protein
MRAGAAILHQLNYKQRDRRQQNRVDVTTLVKQELKKKPDYKQNSAQNPKRLQEFLHVGN